METVSGPLKYLIIAGLLIIGIWYITRKSLKSTYEPIKKPVAAAESITNPEDSTVSVSEESTEIPK